jgi:hypothetical protein
VSSCEKCWRDAGGDSDRYRALLFDPNRPTCTPEEQAGPDAKECPICKRMTLHQHTGECMSGCSASFPQNECACPLKVCRPETNEGRVCWRSGNRIPEGYFSQNTPTSGAAQQVSSTEETSR